MSDVVLADVVPLHMETPCIMLFNKKNPIILTA